MGAEPTSTSGLTGWSAVSATSATSDPNEASESSAVSVANDPTVSVVSADVSEHLNERGI